MAVCEILCQVLEKIRLLISLIANIILSSNFLYYKLQISLQNLLNMSNSPGYTIFIYGSLIPSILPKLILKETFGRKGNNKEMLYCSNLSIICGYIL